MLAVVGLEFVLASVGVSSAKDDSAGSESGPLSPTSSSSVTHVPLVPTDAVVVSVVALTSPSATDRSPASVRDPHPVVSVSSAKLPLSSAESAVLLQLALVGQSSASDSHLVESVVSEVVPPSLFLSTMLLDVVAPVSSDLSSSARSSVLFAQIGLRSLVFLPLPSEALSDASAENPSDSANPGMVLGLAESTELSATSSPKSDFGGGSWSDVSNDSLVAPKVAESESLAVVLEVVLADVASSLESASSSESLASDDSGSSELVPLPAESSDSTNVVSVDAEVDVVLVVALSSPSLASSDPRSSAGPDPLGLVFSALAPLSSAVSESSVEPAAVGPGTASSSPSDQSLHFPGVAETDFVAVVSVVLAPMGKGSSSFGSQTNVSLMLAESDSLVFDSGPSPLEASSSTDDPSGSAVPQLPLVVTVSSPGSSADSVQVLVLSSVNLDEGHLSKVVRESLSSTGREPFSANSAVSSLSSAGSSPGSADDKPALSSDDSWGGPSPSEAVFSAPSPVSSARPGSSSSSASSSQSGASSDGPSPPFADSGNSVSASLSQSE
jgi:epidermal growth factor receptor substrate 15